MLARFQQDLKYALRASLRQPVISLAIIVTMALGIGTTTAIFSVVNALLLRTLPYPHPDRLVYVGISAREANSQQALLMPAILPEVQAQSRAIRQFGGFSPDWGLTLTNAGDPASIDGAYVTPGTLDMLGFRIIAGRDFLPEEQRTGGEKVVLATQRFWNRTFGPMTGIGEKIVTLDGQSYRVVGVVSDEKRLPKGDPQLYLPFALNPYFNNRFAPVMNVVGLLQEGVTLTQVQGEMGAITQVEQKDFPSLRTKRLSAQPLRNEIVGNLRDTLLIIFGAVGILVLIGCVNVANLLLSKATAREREIALRVALGATRRRLLQQLLTESLMLGIAGGVLGLVLAYITVVVLVPQVPFGFPLAEDITVDAPVLLFSLLLSIITGLLFGLVPALHASSPTVMTPLKSGVKASIGDSGRLLRNFLVISEIAMAAVVLISAGLLMRSFWLLSHVDPGFRTSRILTMGIFAAETRYKKAERVQFYDQLTERLKAVPGIESVGAVNRLPLNGANVLISVSIPGTSVTPDKPESIDRRVADPDYFRTLEIPLLKGRFFTRDDRPESANVAIINQAFQQRFWPNEDPLGRQAILATRDPLPVTIVGVVGNVRHHGLDAKVQPELYVPYAQAAPEGMVIVMRTAQAPSSLAGTIRSQVWALDRQMPLNTLPTMEEVVSTSVTQPRFRTTLLATFALLALLLSAVGIYGVVSYSTSRRSSEIGIRVALGAQRTNILGLILGQGVKLAFIGVAIGLIISVFVTQLLSSLLYGIKSYDPFTLAAAPALLIFVAVIACYVPARHALAVNPVTALRIE
jgi:putative ABC transport system permease protein